MLKLPVHNFHSKLSYDKCELNNFLIYKNVQILKIYKMSYMDINFEVNKVSRYLINTYFKKHGPWLLNHLDSVRK